MKKQLKVNKNSIVLWDDYIIEKDRCDSHAKILEWVHHLCKKSDMTTELLQEFIEESSKLNKIDIYVNA